MTGWRCHFESKAKNLTSAQAIPFVLLHLGKPFLETLACIPGGFIFGYVAYRTRSFLPCFVIHFGMYMMMVSLLMPRASVQFCVLLRMGGAGSRGAHWQGTVPRGCR